MQQQVSPAEQYDSSPHLTGIGLGGGGGDGGGGGGGIAGDGKGDGEMDSFVGYEAIAFIAHAPSGSPVFLLM